MTKLESAKSSAKERMLGVVAEMLRSTSLAKADCRRMPPDLVRGDVRKLENRVNIGVSNSECKLRRIIHYLLKIYVVEKKMPFQV